ncbi:MAG: DedA family protein [Chloroflexaceae bacterium]|nr:DedA family protein [Chloroflexaceae bacterium]
MHQPDEPQPVPSALPYTPEPPAPSHRLRDAGNLLLMVAGTLLLTLAMFLVPIDTVERLGSFGYVGVFVLTLLASATIFLPSPALGAALLAGKAGLNPWLVGLLSGVAAGLGEITGYLVGRSGSDLAMSTRLYARVEGWVRQWGVLTVFILAAIPSPIIDVAGLAAGAMRLPFYKYLIACILGKTVRFIVVAWVGYWLAPVFE